MKCRVLVGTLANSLQLPRDLDTLATFLVFKEYFCYVRVWSLVIRAANQPSTTRKVVCLRLSYHKLIIVIRCNTELIGPDDDDDDKIVDETHSPKYFIEGNQVLFGRTRTLFFEVNQTFTGHKLFMK